MRLCVPLGKYFFNSVINNDIVNIIADKLSFHLVFIMTVLSHK